jgi:hypothetical protein
MVKTKTETIGVKKGKKSRPGGTTTPGGYLVVVDELSVALQ